MQKVGLEFFGIAGTFIKFGEQTPLCVKEKSCTNCSILNKWELDSNKLFDC